MNMNRESLKQHCEAMCKRFEDAPTSNAYGEHRLVLDLLEQTEWIPISERLPKAQKYGDKDFSDWVQVTIDIGGNKDDNIDVCGAYYCFSENKWYTERLVAGIVTAWMPKPKPYKRERERNLNE